jgi:hypothetical protein
MKREIRWCPKCHGTGCIIVGDFEDDNSIVTDPCKVCKGTGKVPTQGLRISLLSTKAGIKLKIESTHADGTTHWIRPTAWKIILETKEGLTTYGSVKEPRKARKIA